MSIKNSNGTIRNRTRDLSACSEVAQLNASPSVPDISQNLIKQDKKCRQNLNIFGIAEQNQTLNTVKLVGNGSHKNTCKRYPQYLWWPGIQRLQ